MGRGRLQKRGEIPRPEDRKVNWLGKLGLQKKNLQKKDTSEGTKKPIMKTDSVKKSNERGEKKGGEGSLTEKGGAGHETFICQRHL